jgi:uncharacterized membrane protein
VVGPEVTVLPLEVLRLVVGELLLIFGLPWLCKAVLRAGGQLALHDEDAIYSRKLRAAQLDGDSRRPPGEQPSCRTRRQESGAPRRPSD